MNFFERQAQARSRTNWLIFMFLLGILATIVAGYLGLKGLLYFTTPRPPHMTDNEAIALYVRGLAGFHADPVFHGVAVVTIVIIFVGSLVQILRISGGGSVVATLMGGRLVSPTTKDPLERRLLNVIAEMSLASGTPQPKVYLMESENGINAFAAGFTAADASITVTRGCLVQLSRDELQGVIGHEFSHIYNGDMHLNMRLIGVLAGLLLIARIGMTVLRNLPSSNSKEGGGVVAFLASFGFLMTAVGFFGFMCGRLIKAAVSRERERLADASSVQFTRNPLGLGGALLKIRACEEGSHVAHGHTEEVSHMLFADGISLSIFSLLDTHPPIEERLAAIDPALVQQKVTLKPQTGLESTGSDHRLGPDPELEGLSAATAAGFQGAAAAPRTTPAKAVASVGRPSAEHFAYAQDFIEALPAPLREAVSESEGARAAVYSIFLEPVSSPAQSVRQKQFDLLKASGEGDVVARLAPVAAAAAGLGDRGRLPLLSLCVPVLRELPGAELARFRRNIEALIDANGRRDLSEFALQTVLERRLLPLTARESKVRHRDVGSIGGELSLALSLLAFAGQNSAAEATPAFEKAAGELRAPLKLATPAECTPERLRAAFSELRDTEPLLKQKVMSAFATCVLTDSKVTVREWEVLRAVADSLECPMPPLLAAKS